MSNPFLKAKGSFTFVAFFLHTILGLSQTTVTKGWNGSLVADDGRANGGTVTFTAGTDFPTGSIMTAVSVSITFSKVSGDCPGPGGGDPYNDEIRFVLRGPGGLPKPNRRMINFGDFTGSTESGSVTMSFAEGGGALPANPTTGGPYDPSQNFDRYVDQSPFGDWFVRAVDNAADDELCFTAYSLSITATAPLPVELAAFHATCQDDAAHITWSTASEVGHESFHLQRRATPTEIWKTIEVQYRRESTQDGAQYEYYDQTAIFEQTYYRLQQIDVDGTYSYSKIISISPCAQSDQIIISPNPVVDQMAVNFMADEVATYQVLDAAARPQLKGILTKTSRIINFNNLSPGIYFLQVRRAHRTTMHKVIKL